MMSPITFGPFSPQETSQVHFLPFLPSTLMYDTVFLDESSNDRKILHGTSFVHVLLIVSLNITMIALDSILYDIPG
jgi:hypothetical protein